MSKREQTLTEETASAVTHAIGVLFCVIAAPILVWYALYHNSVSISWAVTIFGFGMLMVYLSSTLYHAVRNARLKQLLQIWDHISIYLLIAGTYTPVVMMYVDSATATLFLTIMWSIVAVGSFLKIFYTGRFKKISLALYLALGWMALFIMKPLSHNIPASVFPWIICGGLCYTLGTVFYVRNKMQYHHAVWHCFVLSGTIAHYVGIFIGVSLLAAMH